MDKLNKEKEFCRLLKKLDKSKQDGLLQIVQGARYLADHSPKKVPRKN